MDGGCAVQTMASIVPGLSELGVMPDIAIRHMIVSACL